MAQLGKVKATEALVGFHAIEAKLNFGLSHRSDPRGYLRPPASRVTCEDAKRPAMSRLFLNVKQR